MSISIFFSVFLSLTLTVNAQSSNTEVLTYDFTTNNAIVNAGSAWNSCIYEYNSQNPSTPIYGRISDFTSLFELEIIDPYQVNVEFKDSSSKIFNVLYPGSDERGELISLFTLGNLINDYCFFNFYGSYGDESHRNGTDVKPFFLFLNGVEYRPSQIRYRTSTRTYTAKFFIDVPVKQSFRLGVSFSCLKMYYEYGPENYDWKDIYSSQIIESDLLYISE